MQQQPHPRLNHFSSSVFLQNRFRFEWVVIEPTRYRCFWSENVIPYPTTLETIRPQSTLAPSRSQKVFFLIPFKATPAATAPIPRRRWLPFPGLEGGPLCHSTTQNPFLFFWLKGITKKNVSTFVQKRIIICNSIAERDSQQLKKYNLAEVKDELMSSMSGILIFKQPVYNTLFRSLDALC